VDHFKDENQTRTEPVYSFRKNSREEVRASFSTFKGADYVDLRVFTKNAEGDTIPTRKGLTVSRAMLPELERAVAALRAASGAQ
jgi:hypothetical protein